MIFLTIRKREFKIAKAKMKCARIGPLQIEFKKTVAKSKAI
jgi:hypothetical protein